MRRPPLPIIVAMIVCAIAVIILTAQCSSKPKVDPALGKAMKETTVAKAAEATATTEKALPVLQERIVTPINKRAERTRHYVQKVQSAPRVVGAPNVPDDDAYRSLCVKGGVYQGHQERGRECRKFKS